MFQGGIGGGAIGVPVMGHRWLRLRGRPALAPGRMRPVLPRRAPDLGSTAEEVVGATSAVTAPHGEWATGDYYALLVSLVLGTAAARDSTAA